MKPDSHYADRATEIESEMTDTLEQQAEEIFWSIYPMQKARLIDTTADSSHIMGKLREFKRGYQAGRAHETELLAAKDAEIAEKDQINSEWIANLAKQNADLQAKLAEADGQEPAIVVKIWNKGGSGEFTEFLRSTELPDGTKLFTKPPITSDLETKLRAEIAMLRDVQNMTVNRCFWLLEQGSPARWITHSEDYAKHLKQIAEDAPYTKSLDERNGIGMNKAWDFTIDSGKAIKFDSKEEAEKFAEEESLLQYGVVALGHTFMGMPATNEEKLERIKEILSSTTDTDTWLNEHDAKVFEELMQIATENGTNAISYGYLQHAAARKRKGE